MSQPGPAENQLELGNENFSNAGRGSANIGGVRSRGAGEREGEARMGPLKRDMAKTGRREEKTKRNII